MRRSPAFHLALGLVVVLFSGMLGGVSRLELHHPMHVRIANPSSVRAANALHAGFIVKYRANALPSGIALLEQHFKGLSAFHYDAIEPGLEFEKVPAGLNFDEVLAFFKADPNVDFVEP